MCTGNICRSPMAEGFLRDRLDRLGVRARVHSAGLLSAGQPASRHGIDILREQAIDIGAHESTTIDASAVAWSDLVVGMAREHVREAVVLRPEAFERAFTLKELVRRGEDVGRRGHGQSLDEWLAKLQVGRAPTDLLGASDDDDIFDPIGSSRSMYERTASEIEDLIDRLVALLFGQESA